MIDDNNDAINSNNEGITTEAGVVAEVSSIALSADRQQGLMWSMSDVR